MSPRVRKTGPRRDVVDAVLERAQYSCEVGGHQIAGDERGRDWSIHHRVPRGMGGTRRAELNAPANLLLVCGSGTTGCHGAIEGSRAGAYAAGWLLPYNADPATRPVMIEGHKKRWVLLTVDDEGVAGYQDCPPPPGVSA